MKDEECDQEKFSFVEKLISELHEMQDLLRDREKIKVEYEKEMSQRIRVEEEYHKIRTSLEEQLAERGTEINRITAERQSIEEEFHKTRTSLEEQLAEFGAEINRITEERQRILQEWTQMMDNMAKFLTESAQRTGASRDSDKS